MTFGAYLRAYLEYLRLSLKYLAGDRGGEARDFLRFGMKAYRQGFADLAERSLRHAHTRAPQDVDIQVELGQVMYWREKLDGARRCFESALAVDPTKPEAQLGIAATLHAQGSESDAIYYYLSYLNDRPTDVRAILSLAAAFQATGQNDAAMGMFERALKSQPDNADVHGQYGRALYELGREGDACAHLRRAAELGSEDTDVYRALGLILESEKRLDEARAQYERAVTVDPLNVAARMLLASVLVEGGPPVQEDNGELALRHASEAVEIMRADGRAGRELGKALWSLGWVHYVRGEWVAAIKVSRQALKEDRGLTPVRFNLGLALLRAGEPEEALKEYGRAVEEVDDALDLRNDGLNDLRATEQFAPDLPGRAEALELLESRYQELREAGRRASAR